MISSRISQFFALVFIVTAPVAGIPVTELGTTSPVTFESVAQTTSGSFEQSQIVATRGEKVEITFSHSGPASLYIGGRDTGYRVRVNVSGSGTSTVTIDTYHSASADPNEYIDGGTATKLYPEGKLSEALVAASYKLDLVVEGYTEDIGVLTLENRPAAKLTARVMPKEIDVGEASQSSISSSATNRTTVAMGDYVVMKFDVPGLQEAINTKDLDGDSSANGIEIFFRDLNPPPNRPTNSFHAHESDKVTPFWDKEEAELLLVWNTEDIEVDDGPRPYNITIELVGERNQLVTEDSLQDYQEITVAEPRISIRNKEVLTNYPWEERTLQLNGSTNLAPKSTLKFQSEISDPRPKLVEGTATVDQDGNFSAQLNYDNVSRGQTVDLRVLGYSNYANWRVTLRDMEARFKISNQTSENGNTVTVTNVSLSVGGFLVIATDSKRRGISGPIGEELIETANISLDPSLNRSTWVTATAYMDANRNGSFDPEVDQPYRMNDSNVSKEAVLFVPESESPSSNTSTSDTGNQTTTTEVTNTSHQIESTQTTLSVKNEEPLTPNTTRGEAVLTFLPVVGALLFVTLLQYRRAGR